MIEHVSLRTHHAEASRRFYERALRPLGYVCDLKYGDSFGFKDDAGRHDFWVTAGEVGTPTHLAFHAPSRKAVEEFHAAALKAGGRDNGAPGPREGYAAYAAFAFDPDGNNVEAVIWEGEPGASEPRRPAARRKKSGRTRKTTPRRRVRAPRRRRGPAGPPRRQSLKLTEANSARSFRVAPAPVRPGRLT